MKHFFSILACCLFSAILLSQNADFKELKYVDVILLKDRSVYQGRITRMDESNVYLANIGGYEQVFARKSIKKIRQVCLNCSALKEQAIKNVKEPNTFHGLYHHFSVGIVSSEKTLPGGNLTWTSGYFVRPRLGVGLGVGIQSYGDYANLEKQNEKAIVTTPVFAELRAYFADGKRTPYVSMAGGYGFMRFSEYGKGGYYFFPSLGTQLSRDNGGNFTLNFGLLMQKVAYDFGSSNFDYQIIQRDIILRRWTLQFGMKF